MSSFLQTTEWLEFQKEVGHKVWNFNDGKIKANIIKLSLPLGKSYLYIPHGPEIEFEHIKSGLKNELANFVKHLQDLARCEKAIFVKIEPLSDVVIELLYRRGFRRSSKQIQPYKTVIMNLNLPEEELLSRMHQKTRYNINLSEKKGLQLEESDGVDAFWKLLKQTAKQDQFSTHPKEYYEKMIDFFRKGKELKTKLFIVKNENQAVGGAIIMLYDDTAYYLHGAMDRNYKPLMTPYFTHWEIMKWAKSVGYHYYDFWGIDARKWPGVTRFKLGWLGSPTRATPETSARREHGEGSGGLVEYPGSFDIPVSKLWYWAYSLARNIF